MKLVDALDSQASRRRNALSTSPSCCRSKTSSIWSWHRRHRSPSKRHHQGLREEIEIAVASSPTPRPPDRQSNRACNCSIKVKQGDERRRPYRRHRREEVERHKAKPARSPHTHDRLVHVLSRTRLVVTPCRTTTVRKFTSDDDRRRYRAGRSTETGCQAINVMITVDRADRRGRRSALRHP